MTGNDEHSRIMRLMAGRACGFNDIPTHRGTSWRPPWYNGGVRVIDYTDATNPTEIGHYVPESTDDPVGEDPSGHRSAYWYNGWIYGNDIDRGFDVFRFSDRMRAGTGAAKVDQLNPQTQERARPLPGDEGEAGVTGWPGRHASRRDR